VKCEKNQNSRSSNKQVATNPRPRNRYFETLCAGVVFFSLADSEADSKKPGQTFCKGAIKEKKNTNANEERYLTKPSSLLLQGTAIIVFIFLYSRFSFLPFSVMRSPRKS
jgi:hypothetical protein